MSHFFALLLSAAFATSPAGFQFADRVCSQNITYEKAGKAYAQVFSDKGVRYEWRDGPDRFSIERYLLNSSTLLFSFVHKSFLNGSAANQKLEISDAIIYKRVQHGPLLSSVQTTHRAWTLLNPNESAAVEIDRPQSGSETALDKTDAAGVETLVYSQTGMHEPAIHGFFLEQQTDSCVFSPRPASVEGIATKALKDLAVQFQIKFDLVLAARAQVDSCGSVYDAKCQDLESAWKTQVDERVDVWRKLFDLEAAKQLSLAGEAARPKPSRP